jgi:hypothetical protein
MDYTKIYNQIIKRAQNRKLEGYFEKHHIVPKCIRGLDVKENIVKLTAREHFLCHMLLCEIHPLEYKLKHALFLMAIGKQKVREKTYVIGSRVYERLKTEYSEMLTGKPQTQETKNKKSKSMLDVWSGKTKEEMSEIGQKIWDTRRKNGNDKVTQKQAENISKSLKGRKITWDRKRNKTIIQYDLDGNVIKEYESQSQASRETNVNQSDISACCNEKQKTAGGFTWKFKN